jgi:hypothetical protein
MELATSSNKAQLAQQAVYLASLLPYQNNPTANAIYKEAIINGVKSQADLELLQSLVDRYVRLEDLALETRQIQQNFPNRVNEIGQDAALKELRESLFRLFEAGRNYTAGLAVILRNGLGQDRAANFLDEKTASLDREIRILQRQLGVSVQTNGVNTAESMFTNQAGTPSSIDPKEPGGQPRVSLPQDPLIANEHTSQHITQNQPAISTAQSTIIPPDRPPIPPPPPDRPPIPPVPPDRPPIPPPSPDNPPLPPDVANKISSDTHNLPTLSAILNEFSPEEILAAALKQLENQKTQIASNDEPTIG